MFGRATAVAAVVVAATITGAPMASASYEDCPFGRVCLFDDRGGKNLLFVVPSCGVHELPDELRGRAESIRTHGNDALLVHWPEGARFGQVIEMVAPWQARDINLRTMAVDRIAVCWNETG